MHCCLFGTSMVILEFMAMRSTPDRSPAHAGLTAQTSPMHARPKIYVYALFLPKSPPFAFIHEIRPECCRCRTISHIRARMAEAGKTGSIAKNVSRGPYAEGSPFIPSSRYTHGWSSSGRDCLCCALSCCPP